jgi:hypothetical protein
VWLGHGVEDERQRKGGGNGGDRPAAHHELSERRATAKGIVLKGRKGLRLGDGQGRACFPMRRCSIATGSRVHKKIRVWVERLTFERHKAWTAEQPWPRNLAG